MPRRPASVTQADIARAIRAVQAAGLPVLSVVVRADGVAVETVRPPSPADDLDSEPDVAEREARVLL